MTTTRNRNVLHEQARALQRWIAGDGAKGLVDAGMEFDKASGELVIPMERNLKPTGRQSRADSANLETGGGYTIAEIFQDAIDVQLKFFAAVRQRATIVTTKTGGPLAYPMVKDFDNEGIEIAENTSVGTQDVEQFGQAKLYARKFASQTLLIPNELLEDAPLALANWLARIIGERCGRGANRKYTNYLLGEAAVAVTTALPASIAGDEIVATFYNLDAGYRDSESCGWLMNSQMTKYVRELKDGNGRYLFRHSKKPGSPDTLLGKPIVPNYAMSSTPTAGTVSALFGDLSKVLVRDVNGVRIKRAEERWADSDQTGLSAYLRSDIALLDIGGNPVQALMQHS